MRKRRTEDGAGLTPIMFQILVALADGSRHGYGIAQEIKKQTDGDVEIGAGTLYRSIRQLVDADLIVEVQPRKVIHSQRRNYRLTPAGRRRASAEAIRLEHMVNWVRATSLL